MTFKQDINIEQDVYNAIKTLVSGYITGTFYRDGNRPVDSTAEDAVVSVSYGTAEQVQVSSVYVNFYVNDIKLKGRFVGNKSRLTELSNKSEFILEALNKSYPSEYYFDFGRTTRIFAEQNINQHFVSMNFSIKRITF